MYVTEPAMAPTRWPADHHSQPHDLEGVAQRCGAGCCDIPMAMHDRLAQVDSLWCAASPPHARPR